MHTNFVPFELERIMSIWEYQVKYNLSESGVHPMSVQELVDDPAYLESLLNLELNYPQTNGEIELRNRSQVTIPDPPRIILLSLPGPLRQILRR